MNWNLMTVSNVCATEDAQISWGVRADSYRSQGSQTCTVSQLRVLTDGIFGFSFISVSHKSKGWLLLLTPGKLPLSLTLCSITAPSSPLQSQLPLCLEIRKLSWLTVNYCNSRTEPWCCAAAKMHKLPAVFTRQLSTQRQGDGDRTWCSREASWN